MTVATRVAGVRLLFCDVVGSTALGVQLGEAATDELRRDLFEALRQPLDAFQGHEVKSQGDGLMVSFTSSMTAVLGCAVAMQRAVARLDAADVVPSLSIRIGVSSGEVTSEDGDWFGAPVVEAARLCVLAEPGQILVADHALSDVAGQGSSIRTLGQVQLKGFTDSIGCSIVDWEPGCDVASLGPLPPPLDVTGHPDLAGFDVELRRGMAAWRQVLAGETRVMWVVGPPRVGRTRYASELVRSATSGPDPILVAYGAAARADPAGAVFARAFRRLALWSPESIVRHLAAVEGIRGLVPAIDVRLSHDAVLATARPLGAAELVDVVIRAVRSASEVGPTIIVLDDMQWADADTLDTLAGLALTASGRVLVVAIFRTAGDDDEALARVRARTFGADGIETVELGALAEADVCSIIDEELDRDDINGRSACRMVLDAVGGLAGDVVGCVRRLSALPPGVSDRAIREVLSLCVPYKGLVPLGPDDATVFFGRDEVVEHISTRLRSRRFVAVTGPSGAGKSSLLQAGVADGFRHAGIQVAVLTPGDDELLARLRSVADSGGAIVLDQFEQLFTVWSAEDRDGLVDGLFDLIDYSRVTWVAIGLRSDFFGRCAENTRLAQRLSDATMLIGGLTEGELRTIVERPAEAASLTLESGLVDLVLADLTAEPSPLPLLSHALYETWRRRRGQELTVADYQEAGGVRRSIARTAERVYGGTLDADGQHTARALFLRLVELSEDASPTRHPMRLDEIVGMFGDHAAPILEVLVTARLVVVDGDKAELAHEALLTEWPRLAGWLENDRERLRVMAHLAQAAHEWDSRERPESELYRGARLDVAIDLAASGVPLTPVELSFLDAGGELRDVEQTSLRRTNRRLRRQLAGALLALVLALAAGGVAVVQQRRADHARADAIEQRRVAEVSLLGGTARQLADSQVDTAALLAIEANRLAPSGATIGTLGTVLRSQPTIVGSRSAEFLAEDSTIVARSFDRSTVVFETGNKLIPVDTATMEPHPSIEMPAVEGSALSPDGSRLAAVYDHALTIASVGTGQITATIAIDEPKPLANDHITWIDDAHVVISPTHNGSVYVIDVGTGQTTKGFSQDESSLITADPEGGVTASVPEIQPYGLVREVTFHDVDSGRRIGGLPVIEAATGATSLEFSPDGRLILVGTNAGIELIDQMEGEKVDIPNQRSVNATGTFSADGSKLATVDNMGTVVEYELEGGIRPIEIARQHIAGANDTFFSAGEQLVVVAGARLVQVTLTGEQPLATAPMGTAETLPYTISPDGQQVYVFERRESYVRLYLPRTGEKQTSPLKVEASPYFFDPSGTWMLTVDEANSSNRLIHTVTTAGAEIADGERLSSDARMASDVHATTLITMDAGSTTPLLRRLPSLAEATTPLRLPAVSNLVLVASDDGRILARIGQDRRGDQRLDVGDLVTGDILLATELASDAPRVTALALSPDGEHVVLGDEHGATTSVDLSTGHLRNERYPSTGSPILWLGYLDDGNLLFAQDQQGRLTIWDTTTHSAIWEPLQSNRGQDFDYPLVNADWAAKWWAITDDQGMRVWNLDFDMWPAIACDRAGRNLTHDEWSRYLPEGEPYHLTCPEFPAGE